MGAKVPIDWLVAERYPRPMIVMAKSTMMATNVMVKIKR